jgi:Asp-tRNA(Asn)/Glu-tRNA(Gln) amidotransferase A subunit family amidase
MGHRSASHPEPSTLGRIERRDFLKAAAAVAATGAVSPSSLYAADPELVQAVIQERQEDPPRPLGQGEPPALQFQAYPGGTGALMEKLWREYNGNPFQRNPIAIDPWEGPTPTDEEDIAFLPVHRLAALIRERRMSSVELTELYLERLKRYDPVLLFAVTILPERAMEEAQQADAEIRAGNWKGPLHGIPYGVKDLFSVSGARTTWGSADFEHQVIEEDAELVVRLRNAGAVLVAKLSTGEFAQGDRWYRGRTLNPWNTDEGSSGSSAGPGSATAAGCVAFAIGTETQGSIVSPSRRNGLSALRPTFGRISRAGGMVLSWSMDKPGPMCRSVADCALVFNEIHGVDEKDPATLTAPFRFERRPNLGAMSIGYEEGAPESFLEKLSDLGADLKVMPELPRGGSNSISVEGAAAFDYHVAPDGVLETIPEGLSQQDQRRETRFHRGRTTLGIEYVNSQRRRHLLMLEMAEVMEDFDLFVSASGQTGLTNQTGHPAVVVPYDFGVRNPDQESPTEMPLTTILVGDLFADDKILSVAHAFQSQTDFHKRRPNLT